MTSALVGLSLVTIEASICVAVITGFDCLPARRINRFWVAGTSSIGSSMPRSPRATMIPLVAAATMPSACSAACGFSILAINGMSEWRSASRSITGSRSSAERTNETASRSTSWSTAKSTQPRSSAPAAGIPELPGRLTPWWEATRPPASTMQRISSPSTSSARRRTLPSARKTGSPSCTAAVRPSQPTGSSSLEPIVRSAVVRVSSLPASISTNPPSTSSSRSFGPGRSPSTPTHLPISSPAARIRSTFSAWLAWSPWEKLSRKTSAPAEIRRSSIFGDREAGPTVATIFVLR